MAGLLAIVNRVTGGESKSESRAKGTRQFGLVAEDFAKLRLVDCIGNCVWLAVPQPTEWQRIGN
jgi:hypothetical protein